MEDIKLEDAVTRFIQGLRDDKDYYYAYQANIAMSFYDEFWISCPKHIDLDLMDSPTLHGIANRAAVRFLDLLISQLKATCNE